MTPTTPPTSIRPTLLRLGPALLAVGIALAGPAAAQKLLDKDLPPGHPGNDPYTRGGDPKFLEAAGYVSMGGFEFGPPDETTETIDAFYGALGIDLEIRWIETEHFELGFALEEIKVTQAEKKKVRAECERLATKLHKVDKRPTTLDPWLRAHLYAQRLEETYDQVLAFLEVEDAVFTGTPNGWAPGTPYWGNGPHMGQSGKYEVFLLPTEHAATSFLREKVGLTTRLSQRWNFMERDSLAFISHVEQDDMRIDESFHGHTVFCVVHNLLNGFKHYSYDLPVWITEGVAHWFERNLNPRFNSATSSEGGAPVRIRKERWAPEVAKLASSGKASSLASLVNKRNFAELTQEDHYTVWSMVDYLQARHPGFLTRYFHAVSGLKNEKFEDDASTLKDVQRDLFKDELGMTYASFERAWIEWAAGQK